MIPTAPANINVPRTFVQQMMENKVLDFQNMFEMVIYKFQIIGYYIVFIDKTMSFQLKIHEI